MDTAALERLTRRVLDSDNLACFIEREQILREIRPRTEALPESERYCFELEQLLGRLSTPLAPEERFAGRMLEGRGECAGPVEGGLASSGHITIAAPEILARGLSGLVAEVEAYAAHRPDAESGYFAACARRAVAAIRGYAGRYADAAERAGKREMAQALRRVPYEPAYDFYSALQSVWLVHFICSTVLGARDFGIGRCDQYFLPFYRADLAAGRLNREQALEYLVFFQVKFNEVSGTATDSFHPKPIPSNASNQYLVLGGSAPDGGCDFQELSELFVEAAEYVKLPKPTLNFRLAPEMPEAAWRLAGRAAHSIPEKSNFFHDRLIIDRLLAAGIEPGDAYSHTYTACNRVDLPGKLDNKMNLIDVFDATAAWFREALARTVATGGNSAAAVIADFREICRVELERYCDSVENTNLGYPFFSLESLFLARARQMCRDIRRGGGSAYRWQHHMYHGAATIGDSLYAVERLVEREKRFTLKQLWEILERDFAGMESLRQELVNDSYCFGNDNPAADAWASAAANAYMDGMEEAGRRKGWTLLPSLYSLYLHRIFGTAVGATPDGRRAHDPVSENQSPTAGRDRNGLTALLHSVARLPLDRCVCGGLNVKLTAAPEPAVASSLMRTFFREGGMHLGLTVVTRRDLEEARRHPEEYRSLCVRITGFSEYFVSLSPDSQCDIIGRTEY